MSVPLPSRGSVFGFDVRSPFAFETLRPGAALPPLRVVPASADVGAARGECVAEITEPGFVARVFRDGSDFSLWVDRIGWFHIDPVGARVEAPAAIDPFEREELVLGVPALLCFLQRGDASLHAAAVDVGGRALLFVAPHGHGKSTLAAAFDRRGYGVLSEDLACIGLAPSPVVLPGPASLRLRNDVAAEIGSSLVCLRKGRERTRYLGGRTSVDGDARVPIAGLVLLRPSSRDTFVEPISPTRALPDLWQASFRLTREHERHAFAALAALAAAVPVHQLFRPLRIDALDAAVDAVMAATNTPAALAS